MPGPHPRATAAAGAAFVLAAVFTGPVVYGLINPEFTPIDLVEDSQLILKVEFGPIKANRCACTVSQVLKGKTKAKALTLDLGKAINENQAGRIAALVAASGKEPGVCFFGQAVKANAGGRRGFLHVAGTWIDLGGGQGDLWQVGKINKYMEGCWAGGTDMLLRAVSYVMTDRDADFPCEARASWSKVVRVGHVAGEVTSIGPVDLDGNGKPYLFVTSSAGDRLFQYRGGALEDVTVEKRLRSKSLASAWLDANADGRIDLVSWDGASLNLYVQGPDGAIVRARSSPAEAPANGCLALSALDMGAGGKPGLLVSTRGAPILLAPGALPMKARELVKGGLSGEGLGKAAACLVADFDGDSHPDIIQPFERGSLFYSGKGSGCFGIGVVCAIAAGKGKSAICTGDFDADGLLDVLTTSKEGCEIWQNLGRGRFAPRRSSSGEIAYIAKPEGIACEACDINNDGRQDIFIAYESMGAQIFFNRGFRSTGHAHKLDLTDNGLLPDAEKGQQAGCIGDFNADGAQDMALVLKKGNVHLFWRDTAEASPLSIKVDLSPKGSFAGPLTVTGWLGRRCLGAWNVIPGTSTGFVGLMDVGKRNVKWRFPGDRPQEKQFVVEDDPVRFLIRQ